MRHCPACDSSKHQSEFTPSSTVWKGKTYSGFRSKCRECERQHKKQKRNADPEAARTAKHLARKRSAEREGREFKPRGPRHLAKENRMLRSALKKIEAEIARRENEAKRQERIKRKPWTDRTLTDAERFRMRYRLDPEFSLRQRVRAALKRTSQGVKLSKIVRCAIRLNGTSPKAEAFLGYTMSELREHLERQFTRGMNWDRFCKGEIHIDHIVPVSSFNLECADDLRSAWCITNLRPLWASDNLRKGSKQEYLI